MRHDGALCDGALYDGERRPPGPRSRLCYLVQLSRINVRASDLSSLGRGLFPGQVSPVNARHVCVWWCRCRAHLLCEQALCNTSSELARSTVVWADGLSVHVLCFVVSLVGARPLYLSPCTFLRNGSESGKPERGRADKRQLTTCECCSVILLAVPVLCCFLCVAPNSRISPSTVSSTDLPPLPHTCPSFPL